MFTFDDIFNQDAMDMADLDQRFELWAKRFDRRIAESLRGDPWVKYKGKYTKKSQCNKYRLVAHDTYFRLYFQSESK